MSEPDEMEQDAWWFADDGPEGIGCCNCGHSGWNHGCCDDICRNCYEPEDCPSGRPCKHCNPDGDCR